MKWAVVMMFILTLISTTICQLKCTFRPQCVICDYLDEVDTLDDVDIDDDVDTELEVDTLKGIKNDYLGKIEKYPK